MKSMSVSFKMDDIMVVPRRADRADLLRYTQMTTAGVCLPRIHDNEHNRIQQESQESHPL
jgi:hypothetical protein